MIERAVGIYERLVQDNFAEYGPDLADGLNNLSLRLANSGRRVEGLAAIERAVAIRERLAQDNFAAYGPDLAGSLNNWSNRLVDVGDIKSKRLVNIRARLQHIKDRVRDENIQVPAYLAWLFETDQADEDADDGWR